MWHGCKRTLCFLLLMGAPMAFAQHSPARAQNNRLPDAPSELFLSEHLSSQASWNDSAYILAVASEAQYKERLESTDLFTQELRSALSHKNFSYQPATSTRLLGRATEAATRTFISQTPSGKEKLNTSYLVSVLGSAIIHTAYRPYWNRPVSAPFSDFGSRVGNDAGMNVLHEFGPTLEQVLKSHTPAFVTRIAAGLAQKQPH